MRFGKVPILKALLGDKKLSRVGKRLFHVDKPYLVIFY